MVTITAKIQLYVPKSDTGNLQSTMLAYQKACNWLSEKVFETKELKQRSLNGLYYTEIRQSFGLKSQMA